MKKLELEILELDKELNEDEVVKEVVEEVVNVDTVLNGTVVSENSVTIPKNSSTLYNERKVEIEVENARRKDERESVQDILLFSILNGDLDLEMSIDEKFRNNNNNNNDNSNDSNNNNNNSNDNDDNDDNINIVSFSVKDYFTEIKSKETGIQIKKEKKNNKEGFDADDDVLDNAILILKSKKEIPSIFEIKNDEDDKINKKSVNFDYFLSPDSELAKFLVEAFEVKKFVENSLKLYKKRIKTRKLNFLEYHSIL